jgi:NADPH:quinone reductase
VLGAAGAVGLATVELGTLIGARVIAAASSQAKLELCRAHGATETINYCTEGLKIRIRELTSGGADVIFDPLAAPVPNRRCDPWHGMAGFCSSVSRLATSPGSRSTWPC